MATAMAKQPTKQQQRHSWAVFHIKGAPAKLPGIIDNARCTDRHCACDRGV